MDADGAATGFAVDATAVTPGFTDTGCPFATATVGAALGGGSGGGTGAVSAEATDEAAGGGAVAAAAVVDADAVADAAGCGVDGPRVVTNAAPAPIASASARPPAMSPIGAPFDGAGAVPENVAGVP